MIKVKCDVECYAVDGKETSPMNNSRPVVSISNDPLHNDRVVLTFPDGKTATVLAWDVQAAVQNATNRGAR